MKIIENNHILLPGFKAITILNMIIVRKGTKLKIKDINHESIHFEQEKELLFVGFYILYMIEFIIRFILYMNSKKAYREISFEKEAYLKQEDMEYIKTRKHYSWLKLI